MARKVEKNPLDSEKMVQALSDLRKWYEESNLLPPAAASIMGVLIARFDEFEDGGYSIKSLLTSLAFTIVENYQPKEKKSDG